MYRGGIDIMRILIIEDELPLAQALAELLKKENYIADIAGDGLIGLDYALSGAYDVIILDIMLPKMDGFAVLRGIRSNKISTPVMLLTAKYQISDKVTGLDLGADDYLTKPFSTDELLARVRALGRRKGEVIDDALTFSDVTLKLKLCELCGPAGSVSLGLKEFQLIELLMRNSDQIVTKDTIIEKVWSFDGDVEYNNVEVYISFLRKKLSYVSDHARIKTVRGVGYKMEAV